MEIFITGWILLSIGVGYLANERGRNWIGWSLLSLLTSPLLGIIIVLLNRNLIEEEANQRQNENRHREQLAALSGRNDMATQRIDMVSTTKNSPAAAGEHVEHQINPVRVADELQKLAALRDNGILTADEFIEQKDILLASTRTIPQKNQTSPLGVPKTDRLLSKGQAIDTSTAEACTALLVSLGYRISRPTQEKWEIANPVTGVLRNAYSTTQLQSLTLEIAQNHLPSKQA